MSPIDYTGFRHGKGPTRTQVKAKRDARKHTALRRTYDTVDSRDKQLSWVSGRPLTSGHVDDDCRLEHHHLERRAQSKARIADPNNVISVSAREADLLDTHALIPVDASGGEVKDTRLIHGFAWNRAMVKPGAEPFPLPARAKRAA